MNIFEEILLHLNNAIDVFGDWASSGGVLLKVFAQHTIQEGFWFYLGLVVLSLSFAVITVYWLQRRLTDAPATNQLDTNYESENDLRRGSDGGADGEQSKYRFRKRDKAAFMGRRLLRRVKSLGVNGSSGRKIKPHDKVLKFATRWLFNTKEKPRTIKRPPATFFEPDTAGEESQFPPEVLYMLRNIRVFGHFETPFFLELCRHVKEIQLCTNQYLFHPGDPDDSIYVVQSGQISVFVKDNETEFEVKKAGSGESILSLLSILDVLTGHSSPFKTVSARANVDSTVLKLSGSAFSEIFERYPESWMRTVQIIALRLQRVTFTTLHHYLGLSTELTKPTLRDPPVKKSRNLSGSSMDSPKINRRPSAPLILNIPSIPKNESISSIKSAAGHEHPQRIDSSFRSSHSRSSQDSLSSQIDNITEIAKAQLINILGLSDEREALDSRVRVLNCPPGYTLAEQGSEDSDLIYVLSGALELIQTSFDDDRKQIVTAIVHSHELVGGLAVLTGEPTFYTVKVRQASKVAIISKEDFYQIMQRRPRVVLNVAHTVVMRLSPFIRSIDFALDWEMSEAGKALYNQGDLAESLYVVLSGRLRSVITKQENVKAFVREYGRGDLVGLIEMVTSRPRATTVMTVRYTELAKLPRGLLDFIKMRFPQVLTRIIQLLGESVISSQQTRDHTHGLSRELDPLPHVANLNTIAVTAVNEDVPLTAFTLELAHAMNAMKPTLRLSRDIIERDLGPTALLPVNEYRLFSWLSHQEDAYPVVLYQCDFEMSAWARRCIRQADCILIVANGDSKPTVGQLEEVFERLGVRAQKELILLWREGTEQPTGTQEWLDACGWVASHFHLRIPSRMSSRRNSAKLTEIYERVYNQRKPDPFSDFSRLARTLTGCAIGVVLGGGGARGAAHIGILKALREAGIPIDFIGGVSMGAFIGGLYCSYVDIPRVAQKARQWFMNAASLWRRLLELTYPYSAIFTGSGFNRSIRDVFKDRQIEDLWLPYFNLTTDITASEMRIHQNGSLWQYTRASMSYCGILPPMCDPLDGHYLVDGCYVDNLPGPLWRYCRASMSLAGYLPPLCDNDDHQLLDGAYVNNLPADVMRTMGIREILAVDVGAQDETNLTSYGDSLNGFWVLWRRWIPWGEPIRILNMAEIQSRLAYVSCVRQLEQVKKAPYCHYIRPPIDKYQTLDFGMFDEIYNVGYQHGKTIMESWQKSGTLHEIIRAKGDMTLDDYARARSIINPMTTQSFTDLAAFVSKIKQPFSFDLISEYSEEESDESPDGDGEGDGEGDGDAFSHSFNYGQTDSSIDNMHDDTPVLSDGLPLMSTTADDGDKSKPGPSNDDPEGKRKVKFCSSADTRHEF